MRTRSASVLEKTIFYALGIASLLILFIASMLIVNQYEKKIDQINQDKAEREQQKIKLEADIIQTKNDIQKLKIDIERAVEKKGKEQEEYDVILNKLNNAKNLLPKTYIKPDIMNQIIKKLEDLNLRIGYFVEKQTEYFSIDFTSSTFQLEISGDYFRLKKFLYFLEKPLKISDSKSPMIWNVVLKVPYPEGVNFYRYTRDRNTQPDKNGDIAEKEIDPLKYVNDVKAKVIKIEKVKIENDQNNARRNQPQNQPQEIEVKKFDEELLKKILTEEFLYLNSYVSSNMKIQIEIKTFFITEKE